MVVSQERAVHIMDFFYFLEGGKICSRTWNLATKHVTHPKPLDALIWVGNIR